MKSRLKQLLLTSKSATSNNVEWIIYGLEYFLLSFINIAFALIISSMLDTSVYCLLFICFFYLLRRVAGGFHASSPSQCFIFTQLFITFLCLAIKHVKFSNMAFVLIMLISQIIILFRAPLISLYKHIDEQTLHQFKIKCRAIMIFYSLSGLISFILSYQLLSSTLLWVLFSQAVLLLIPEKKHKSRQ